MYLLVLVAMVVGLYFASAAWERPRPAAVVAAILWLLYAIYEFQIASGVLCDAQCNIRVDLVLALPLLGIATLFACNTPGQRSVVKRVLGVISLIIFVLLVAPLVYIALVGFPADTQPPPNSQPSPK